jgi:hypothetical protein
MSREYRCSSPYHSPERKVELNSKLSSRVMFGVLVVAAAASLVISLTACKAAWMPVASAVGSVAPK